MIVTDEDLEDAMDWLIHKAPTLIGQARRRHTQLEHMRKVTLAIQSRLSGAKTVAEREQEALCSDEYREHIEALAKADAQLAAVYAMRDGKQLIVEKHRDQSIGIRMAGRNAV